MRLRLFVVAGAALALNAMLSAQAPGPPSFDAASIKPNASDLGGVPNVLLSGGRYVATAATLRSMIAFAYQPLLERQVVGGPAWLDSDRFDVQAKGEGNAAAGRLRLMVRTLLAERFALRAHAERRQAPVYLLVMARDDRKAGPQLKPGTVDCPGHAADAPPTDAMPPARSADCAFLARAMNIVGVGVRVTQVAKGITIPRLAEMLTSANGVGRVVLDRTGLGGSYDVELTFGAGNAGPALDAATIFTALTEQLGLKLETATEPIDVLVIDSAEHPSQN